MKELCQTKTVNKITYKVNTLFKSDTDETVADRLKKMIEKQIVTAPLKSEKKD